VVAEQQSNLTSGAVESGGGQAWLPQGRAGNGERSGDASALPRVLRGRA
jgi:hypothetical protein